MYFPLLESRSVQIVSNLPDHITDSDGVLEFSKVGVDDGGRYTCVATSPKRVINATITLTVVVKPKFSVKPQNTTVKEGESVLIDCAAEGDPTPTISVSVPLPVLKLVRRLVFNHITGSRGLN